MLDNYEIISDNELEKIIIHKETKEEYFYRKIEINEVGEKESIALFELICKIFNFRKKDKFRSLKFIKN